VVLPEGRGFGIERVNRHQELQFRQRLNNLVLVRERGHRVKALAQIAVHFALVHHLEILQNVVTFIPLRQPVKAPAVFRRCFVTEERFHHRDEELRIVAPVVHLAFKQRFRRAGRQVGLQVGLFLAWQVHVARQALGQQAEVGQTLNVGVTAQGVNAAACHPHVAEQQLHHRHGADVLRADGVLRPAEGVQERRGFVFRAGFGDQLAHLQEVRLRRPTDVFDNLWRIAGHVLFQQVPHAARVLQGGVTLRKTFLIQLVVPAGFVVLAFFGVVTAKQTIFEVVILTHDQAGIGIGFGVFAVVFFVGHQVQQYA